MKSASKMRIIRSLCLVAIVFSLPNTGKTQPQGTIGHLPADLIFSTGKLTGKTWIDSPHNILARIDANTLEVHPFYINEEAYETTAISWSPQGNLLAVFLRFINNKASPQSSTDQICLLDRAGILQTCFEDKPYIFGSFDDTFFSWSADSQKFYFVTDCGNEDHCLIEADAVTGRTLQTIYHYSNDHSNRTQVVSWTPKLDYVVINAGSWATRNAPRVLINLENNERLDIKAIVPGPAQLGVLCPNFSPQGTYLVATTFTGESKQSLIVFNKQGNILFTIDDTSGFGAIQPLCPILWDTKEKNFYFNGQVTGEYNFFIFKYSLETAKLEIFYDMGTDRFSEKNIYGPYALFPTAAYIAGTTSLQSPAPQVAILSPSGDVEQPNNPYPFGLYPIWVP